MADDLAQLIGRLRRVSSPLERMKLLARAWRSLRRMTPGERRALADQVGVADAADLIERMATRKGGLSPTAVQRALERFGDTNVGDLRQVVERLRDPQQREELLDRGLDAAVDVVSEPEPEEAAEEATEKTTEQVAQAPSEKRPTAVGPAAAAAAARRRRIARPPAQDPRPATPSSKPVATPPEPKPKKAPSAPVEERAAPPVPQPAELPAAPPSEPTQVTPRHELPGETRPGVHTEPTKPSATGMPLLDRIDREPMLIRRFRILRQRVDEARGLSARQLRDLIELFPPGWGRRRALDALLERGVPGSLNEAIFLIEQLQSESERRWCVRTLLHEWKLTDEEKALLAERHGMFHTQRGAS